MNCSALSMVTFWCDGSAPLRAHSQITRTRHPSLSNAATFRLSRSVFFVSLSRQNVSRVLGHLNRVQSWRCQKQPCTNITVRYFGSTRSGFPGMPLVCRRYLKPLEWRDFRTINSGLVLVPRMPDIILDRVWRSTTSTTLNLLLANTFVPGMLAQLSELGLENA